MPEIKITTKQTPEGLIENYVELISITEFEAIDILKNVITHLQGKLN